ncbi:outer membrane protein [Thalassobaculum fulvum]|uniref:Outer membrane protein n=1 Tax=Thalassobaculum fulvum TaxID=1633335 RepID=A0A919CQ50_9PROT|nr:DsbA family protein [Thalassobaculum fulvum]GHD53381.1 outer membrane protein [Thalassobaculum fulvum]
MRSVRLPSAAPMLGAAMLAAFLTAATAAPAAEPFTPEQKAAVEAIVRDYIARNPELVLEAIAAIEAKQKAEKENAVQAALAAHRDVLERSKDDPVLGNPDGDVTVVEFFDYQCGYCKSMAGPMRDLMRSDGKIRWVMKEFPILGPESAVAARAALAAARQGKYEPFHFTLMGLRGRLSEPAIWQAAAETGLDLDKLRKDMADPAIQATIDANYQLAEVLQIQGTPAFTVGRTVIPGAAPKEHLAELVRRVRAGGG